MRTEKKSDADDMSGEMAEDSKFTLKYCSWASLHFCDFYSIFELILSTIPKTKPGDALQQKKRI